MEKVISQAIDPKVSLTESLLSIKIFKIWWSKHKSSEKMDKLMKVHDALKKFKGLDSIEDRLIVWMMLPIWFKNNKK